MKTKMSLLLVLFLGLSCCQKKEQRIHIQTEMGEFQIRLYDDCPQHRDNFLKLAQSGFYDSLLFHRVVRDFMIQGGDPDSKTAPAGMLLGAGSPGYNIPAEIKLPPLRGAIAAGRLPDHVNSSRQSNGAQFFIVHGQPQNDASLNDWEQRLGIKFSPERRNQYKTRGGAPQLEGLYTVFGEVVAGLDVLDKIAAVPRDANDRPLEDIRMRVWVE